MVEREERLSVYLSLILRHKPGVIGLELDNQGYLKVEEVIKGIRETGRNIDRNILDKIVNEDDKGRYSYSVEGTKIRANQGHSIKVDLGLEVQEPPKELYHGTATKYEESIKLQGIVPGSREYVHLTEDKETALTVGGRHGVPIVYAIDTKKMVKQGYKFYKSVNGVWLTLQIPSTYLDKRQ